jgi:hypothetical protein
MRGLAVAWSQLLAIRLLLVPIGVGVGIGIGIDSDCVLWLILTHTVASLPEFCPIFYPSIPIPIPIPTPIIFLPRSGRVAVGSAQHWIMDILSICAQSHSGTLHMQPEVW